MDWVAAAAQRSGRPSVASVSLGGGYLAAVNDAAAQLVSIGVTTVVAAGNSNTDAASFSPASAPSVIAVGATTIADAKAPFSNYGIDVTIWAPGAQSICVEITGNISSFPLGEDIISTWIEDGVKSISGTSAAAPYVAGYVAYILHGDSSLSPANIATIIALTSFKNVLSGIRTFINGSTFISIRLNSLFLLIASGTPNALLNNYGQK